MFKAVSFSLRQCGDIMSSSVTEVLFHMVLLDVAELERPVNSLDSFAGIHLNFTCLLSIINLAFYVLYNDCILLYLESQLISKLNLRMRRQAINFKLYSFFSPECLNESFYSKSW